MNNEIIEVKNTEVQLSQNDIQRVGRDLQVISQFVTQILKEGIHADVAKIPGTPKKSLLKPGAEKLMKLFRLGITYDRVENTIDRYEGFAMFSYVAKVYRLDNPSVVIAECEGTCNSWEKKYKKHEVMDIINTLKKMAQKRAMVGAVIMATGASDYLTQDEDEIAAQKVNQQPIEKKADKFLGNNNSNGDYVVKMSGGMEGKKLSDIDKTQLINYLNAVVKNNQNPFGDVKEFIDKSREYLRA